MTRKYKSNKGNDLQRRLRANRLNKANAPVYTYHWKRGTFLIQVYGAPAMVKGYTVRRTKEDNRPLFAIDCRGGRYYVTHVATARSLGEFFFTGVDSAKLFAETMIATEGIDWTVNYTTLVDEDLLEEGEDKNNAGLKQWILSIENEQVDDAVEGIFKDRVEFEEIPIDKYEETKEDIKLQVFMRYIHQVYKDLIDIRVTNHKEAQQDDKKD